ncbi:flagellar hook-associated protein FlgK [Permianibacter sp. IMCC34836]|uniref:flagellar hook-associated protein FlgK n=1 Tax=Permianibacter fluminis TaxID=2738515 RepID=UPI00155331F3|nr:flagellar hook-associated protein FlgK [Permianibacter fluminis]NQD38063.1 flagellar hook-associated protein FlgK [Permianibacter fluminis]
MAIDILNVGVSGLIGSQLGISTTSHNIANVNTAGYNRQRTDYIASLPQFLGSQYFGSGVELSNVERIFSQTLINELRTNSNGSAGYEAYLQEAQRLDNLVADADTGLNQQLQAFFASLQGVSDNPSSIPARQVLLSQAQMLAGRFQSLDSTLSKQRDTLNDGIVATADHISAIARDIAQLNNAITGAVSAGGGIAGQPNDMRDQRDRLLDELATLTNVTTIDQADGSTSVFLGNGQALVIGVVYNTVVAQPSVTDPRQYGVFLQPSSGSAQIDITSQISGGKLGGLFQFRRELLEPAINTLGRVAIGLSETMNDQHALGMDLNNQLGGLFFTDFNDPAIATRRVLTPTGYAGPGSFSVDIVDPNTMTDSNYLLTMNAGTYTVTRLSDNTVVSSFAAPAPPATVNIGDGISLNIAANANNGDSFILAPTRGAAGEFDRVIDDVRGVAAALPVSTSTSLSNTGSGLVKSVQVTDTSTAVFATPFAITPPLRINFTSATTYDVIDNTTNAVLVAGATFVPNQDNNLLATAGPPVNAYGYEVVLAGAPRTGDQFFTDYNTGGIGDNRNSQLMAALQNIATLDNGRSNYSQAYGRLIAEVGTRTSEAEVNAASTKSLVEQTKARRDSLSGVNLDEEAANLLRFQQSYEASAQVISVARSLFDTLFQSVR